MLKESILQQLDIALRQSAADLNGLATDNARPTAFRLERPRNPEHGDYAVNVSFLAKETRMPPPKIAATLGARLPNVTIVGGYLNFSLPDEQLAEALHHILQAEQPGRNDSLADQRILLEYVSANPTGPLHIGHGRWAALGDAVVRILRHCGATVTAEFYINDAGVQMMNIAESVRIRGLEILKEQGCLPAGCEIPGDLPYPGEYVREIAEAFLADPERKERFLAECASSSGNGRLRDFVRERVLADQQDLLAALRVGFDVWTSEQADIHNRHLPEQALEKLKKEGYVYEAEDAVWFRSSAFGDEKDRVLRKSDGSYTYLMPDIAYHDDKFNRLEPTSGRRYTRIVNIWGADHHGYIPRMQGAIRALGHDPEIFEVLLGQLVNLIVDGERTRMGKRRRMLTLRDVVDEVGVDATRYWMVSKSADSALDFDVDLAASASQDNPVFYVQYAHARCCGIRRNATEPAPNVDEGMMSAPSVTREELENFRKSLTPDDLRLLFDSMPNPDERAVLRVLILLLDRFEDTVKDAARLRAPQFLPQYLQELSAQFHSFYGVCRILTADPALTRVRLMLVEAVRKTLAQGLDLLGVSAPETM